jgi:hypothetical protein
VSVTCFPTTLEKSRLAYMPFSNNQWPPSDPHLHEIFRLTPSKQKLSANLPLIQLIMAWILICNYSGSGRLLHAFEFWLLKGKVEHGLLLCLILTSWEEGNRSLW